MKLTITALKGPDGSIDFSVTTTVAAMTIHDNIYSPES